MRIAMWSGPRNLSTAMMYSFGARADCAVVDEPYYAAYLAKTGLKHPMRDEILASQATDPDQVAYALGGAIPNGHAHYYQKHMCQHMIDGISRDWMVDVKNVFLIRHPARVVASYAAKREGPTADDIGFWQQAALYDEARARGQTPIVIDSHDIRDAPEPILCALCSALELVFDPAMMSWPKGGHADDGVWARHWYSAVHGSTGFAGAEGPLPELSDAYAELAQGALPFYEKLRAEAITV